MNKIRPFPLNLLRKGHFFPARGQGFEQPRHVPALDFHYLPSFLVLSEFRGVVAVDHLPVNAWGEDDLVQAEVICELVEGGDAARAP